MISELDSRRLFSAVQNSVPVGPLLVVGCPPFVSRELRALGYAVTGEPLPEIGSSTSLDRTRYPAVILGVLDPNLFARDGRDLLGTVAIRSDSDVFVLATQIKNVGAAREEIERFAYSIGMQNHPAHRDVISLAEPEDQRGLLLLALQRVPEHVDRPSTVRCGCCHAENVVQLLAAPDRDGKHVTVYHCPVCCALSPDYPADSRGMIDVQTSFHEEYWRDDTAELFIRSRDDMLGLIEFHKKHLPDPGEGLIYDLGAGRANLLACLVAEGYNAVGCEPSLELVSRAKSVYSLSEDTLSAVDIESFLKSRRRDKGRVSTIFLWHVLEHLADPVETLRRCAEYLSDVGVIVAQGPLLAPQYVYREHNFLHSESNIGWLAREAKLNLLLCEAHSAERFVSFVFAKSQHPGPQADAVFITDPIGAAGSLYYTLSNALTLLYKRS